MGNRAKRATAKQLQQEQISRRNRRVVLWVLLIAVVLIALQLLTSADRTLPTKSGSPSAATAAVSYGPEDVTLASKYGINYRTVPSMSSKEVAAGYGHQAAKADYAITKFRDVSDTDLLEQLWRVLATRGLKPEDTEPRLREYFRKELIPLGQPGTVHVTIVPQVHNVDQPMGEYYSQAARQCQREIAGYLQTRTPDQFGLVIENVWCLETGVLDKEFVLPAYITEDLPNKAALMYALDHPGLRWNSATSINLMKYAEVVEPIMHRGETLDLEAYELWQEFRSRAAACQAVSFAREWNTEVVLVYGMAHYPSILQTLQRHGAQVRVWLPSRFR